jgi:hypothetical protein
MHALSTLVAQNQIEFTLHWGGILALVAGILILIVPRLLNYIVAIWLIVFGLVSIFNI